MDQEQTVVPAPEALRHFWTLQRSRAHLAEAETYFGATSLGAVQPPAWAGSDVREEADHFAVSLLAKGGADLVTPLSEYPEGEQPVVGTFSILCDGAGVPVALVAVEAVEIDADHEVVRETLRVVKARS